MILIDLLSIIDDNSEIRVFQDENEYIYNGVDCIPEKLNNESVANVYEGLNFIGIELK